MKTIRIGIIGCGGNAAMHAKAYRNMDDVEIVAVADIAPNKANDFIRILNLDGTQAYSDHKELLELDLDGVSISVPNSVHYPVTVDALEAGKHVLVEKPMSVSLEQGVEMVRTAKSRGKILTVGFQPRYDPNIQHAKQIIASGQLGHVYYVDVGGGRRRHMPGGTFIRKELAGSGAIADIGCYSLDLALELLGHPIPQTVSAYTAKYFGTNPKYHKDFEHFEVEDFGAAFIRFAGGIVMQFKISWAMHMDSLGPAIFMGTDGGLKLQPPKYGSWAAVDGMSLFHDMTGRQTETEIALSPSIDTFYEKVRQFVVAMRDGLPAPIPGEQILINTAIIDGMLRSANQGREVEIHIPKV